MRVHLSIGLTQLNLEVADARLLTSHRALKPTALADPADALRGALDAPLRYPPLWRALTPDDHVTIVVDERLPGVGKLLTPILEHIGRADVAPAAITLLCPPSDSNQEWLEDLPEAFEDVHVEMHDPTDRKKLAYLATTKQGRRLYLSRAAVEADQVVVLGRRCYDPVLGYGGFEGLLYPELSEEATRQELGRHSSLNSPEHGNWPVRQEASEAAWLLGAPFMIQVIEGAGDELSQVLAGSLDSGKDGQQLLNQIWKVTTVELADTVVAALSGDPKRHQFAELAAAAACAARVVQPGGRIVLLSQARPKLGVGATLVRQAESPAEALKVLAQNPPADMAAAFQWASAAERASLYVLSELPQDAVEDLFATPLTHAEQVQRLLEVAKGTCLLLPDAHKTLAVAAERESS